MTTTSSQAYLRNAVLTATPEQLQLMLYDGAIRFTLQGKEALAAKNWELVYEKLSRAQRIILEMEAGLRPEIAPELCDRVGALYRFVYRKLVDGCVNHNAAALDDALGILRYERETWSMLLNKLASERRDASPADPGPDGAGSLSVQG